MKEGKKSTRKRLPRVQEVNLQRKIGGETGADRPAAGFPADVSASEGTCFSDFEGSQQNFIGSLHPIRMPGETKP